jgi:hypothetical protein
MTDESSDVSKAIENAIEKLAVEFGGSLDHDSVGERRWAQVPEPIRKDVEQHVARHYQPTCSRNGATSTPAENASALTNCLSISVRVWPSEIYAENGSRTAN